MSNKLNAFRTIICLTIFFCAATAPAQSGGAYQITQFVLATGDTSSGGTFSIENTGGQPLAGPLWRESKPGRAAGAGEFPEEHFDSPYAADRGRT